jgi:hypothetical protein
MNVTAFCPDDGGSTRLWNVDLLIREYTAPYSRRLLSSFTTVFTRSHHNTILSQFNPFHTLTFISLKYLDSSARLPLGSQSYRFPSNFPTKILYVLLISFMRATSVVHLSLLIWNLWRKFCIRRTKVRPYVFGTVVAIEQTLLGQSVKRLSLSWMAWARCSSLKRGILLSPVWAVGYSNFLFSGHWAMMERASGCSQSSIYSSSHHVWEFD